MKQESCLKSERRSGGTPSRGEVIYSQSRNALTGPRNERPRRGNFRERARHDMTIIYYNCRKKGHKNECWSRPASEAAGPDSGNRGQRGRSRTTSRRGNTGSGTGDGNQSMSAIWSFNGSINLNNISSSSEQEWDEQ